MGLRIKLGLRFLSFPSMDLFLGACGRGRPRWRQNRTSNSLPIADPRFGPGVCIYPARGINAPGPWGPQERLPIEPELRGPRQQRLLRRFILKYRIWRVYTAGSAYAFDHGWMELWQVLAGKHVDGSQPNYPFRRDFICRGE